jgi:hypothetical protein
MPADHRGFLISFERGEPDWDSLGLPNAAELPAVRWRQQNLEKLPPNKRAILVARLEEVLSGRGLTDSLDSFLLVLRNGAVLQKLKVLQRACSTCRSGI